MEGTSTGAGRARWVRMLLARVCAIAAAAFLLQLSVSAAWDAHVLQLRGERRAATVVEVTRTSWGKADRAVLAVAGPGPSAPARVTTPRKDLEVGAVVEAIVDPREPHRAAIAGDGWPWRQVLIPLCGLPLAVLLGVRWGRVADRLPEGPVTGSGAAAASAAGG